jgi:hypothetical protein
LPDIRLVQNQGSRLWVLVLALAVGAILVWASAFMLGDATAPDELPRVGAAADFGALRASVPPVEPVPFETLTPIQTRDRGRLVRVTGIAESRIAVNSLWMRTGDGHRVLVRFEPTPPTEALEGIYPGASIALTGYVQNIAFAELRQILDSLQVRLPRPPPARKFGDLPDPAFARVDSLYIKDYYISVRPEGLQPDPPRQTSI